MLGKKDPVVVERYDSEKAYQKDANKMARKGYVVDNVVTKEKGKGCLSWGLLGIFNIFRKKKHEYVVTYKLQDQ